MKSRIPPRKFWGWLEKSYWRYQGFWIGVAAALAFVWLLVASRQLDVAVVFAILTVLCGAIWAFWARRWGRFRDHDPWEEP
jgi:hypothetical protein